MDTKNRLKNHSAALEKRSVEQKNAMLQKGAGNLLDLPYMLTTIQIYCKKVTCLVANWQPAFKAKKLCFKADLP